MKKCLSIVICILLVFTSVSALAVDYTVPEKLQRQLSFGNGLRGELLLETEGESPWLADWSRLSGTALQLRAISSSTGFEYQLYAEDEKQQQTALTQLYGDENRAYLRSQLLGDTVYTLPLGETLLSAVMPQSEGKNPVWYGIALRMMQNIPQEKWESAWLPALLPYQQEIEVWMSRYMTGPAFLKGSKGQSQMQVDFLIPAADVKEVLKQLIARVMGDETLLPLLRSVMNDAEAAIYLNPGLSYFYTVAIDGLKLPESVRIVQTLSAKGEVEETRYTLPLPENEQGYTLCEMTSQGETLTAVTLKGEGLEASLKLDTYRQTAETLTLGGTLRLIQGDVSEQNPAYAVSFALTKAHAISLDAENVAHDTNTWTLKVEPDLSDEAIAPFVKDFAPLEANVKCHLYSAANDQRKPTYISLTSDLGMAEGTLKIGFEGKTAAPWEMFELPKDGAVEVLQQPLEALMALQTMGTKAVEALAKQPESTIAPLEAATEATAVPEAETTATPTEEMETAPTQAPTAEPTAAATTAPTAEPTQAPSEAPTTTPAEDEPSSPTAEPTETPVPGNASSEVNPA